MGSVFHINFLRKNSEQIVRERETRERDRRPRKERWKWLSDLFRRGFRMDTRQKDKEKEKEKDMVPEERTPKVSGVDREQSALAGG